MKTTRLALLLSVLSLGIVHAEVEAVNIVLHDGGTSYGVPTSKVLIIEHFIWSLESGSTAQFIAIDPPARPSGVSSFVLKFPDAPDMHTPTRPIRLMGGGRVSIVFNTLGADWRDVMITGLLVDTEDLYAATIKTELDKPRVVGGRLLADATFDSPRPRVIKVESSETVEAFAADTSSEVEETASPRKALVSVRSAGSRKVMRVAATVRAVE